ncbi:hypothetical protein [uncultured Dokdonia sp.]|uniref:hypothetical protein n=1 Tax=uncultured Dokdonia sp. TaxID=575653 RepID=UPI0026030B18|nr:hypothetical protein [uncultured Dokdonia sp.]
MKAYAQLTLLFVIFLLVSCKENTTEQKVVKSKTQIELKEPKDIPVDTIGSKKKVEVPKQYKHKFVIARSGLNYRDAPKGNILGKFPLNTQLKIIEYPKITDQIKEGETIMNGEWVGVEKDTDTVYVFNGFLSFDYVTSDIKLYLASSYYKEQEGTIRTAFINVSETYFENRYNESNDDNENSILTEANLKKDTIRLTKSQRSKFLKFSNISESDTAYIYSIADGNVETLPIKDLPVIACMNIYGSYNDNLNQEHDYEFGFDLGTNSYGEFVFIGKNNPFHTEKLTPIIWKKIDTQDVQKEFNPDIITDHRKRWFNGYEVTASYSFSKDHLTYYIQDLTVNKTIHRYLIVVNTDTEKIVFEHVLINSESTYLVPLRITDSTENYNGQWTGKLFKNKEAVLFGFLGYSFGCPSISILDTTEPPIRILCDNRH